MLLAWVRLDDPGADTLFDDFFIKGIAAAFSTWPPEIRERTLPLPLAAMSDIYPSFLKLLKYSIYTAMKSLT